MHAEQPVSGEAILSDFTLTIDGESVAAPRTFGVINPATEQVFAQCPDASREQVDMAVAAARRAAPGWQAIPFDQRRALLLELSDRIQARRDELAVLVTREQGKTLKDALGEVGRTANYFEGLTGFELPVEILYENDQRRVEVHSKALGVVGAITPWNSPLLLACIKVVSSLITGNTVVLKPSPYTPLSAVRLGEIGRDIFPPGVLNVLSGGDEVGKWMTAHPGIDKISFTGSVPTGKNIMQSSADSLKRVTLELGGNDAAIVLEDADPVAIAPKLFAAAFANSGQVCVAIKRLYVHENIYEPLCGELARLAGEVSVGDGLDPDSDLGPIQNAMQYDKVLSILEDTKQRGARILSGGEPPDRPGYFLPPTVVADISDGARLVDEEPFGPILPVISFNDIDDAIQRANASSFGLGGSVWTADEAKGVELAGRLEVGTAWVNQHAAVDFTTPFGGTKESGIGVEYSKVGLMGYTAQQIVNVAKT